VAWEQGFKAERRNSYDHARSAFEGLHLDIDAA
jgi:hypothetical protein